MDSSTRGLHCTALHPNRSIDPSTHRCASKCAICFFGVVVQCLYAYCCTAICRITFSFEHEPIFIVSASRCLSEHPKLLGLSRRNVAYVSAKARGMLLRRGRPLQNSRTKRITNNYVEIVMH